MAAKRQVSIVPTRPVRQATFHHVKSNNHYAENGNQKIAGNSAPVATVRTPIVASRTAIISHSETKNPNLRSNGEGRETPPTGGFPSAPARSRKNGNDNVKEIQKIKDSSTHSVRASNVVASLDDVGNGLQGLMTQLENLAPLERKKVLDFLALQSISTKTDHDRDIAMWSVALHDGLQATLGGLDMSAYGVVSIRKLVGAAKTWRPVADLATALGMDKLPVSERQYAYHVLAGVLLRHANSSAQRTGAALSLPYVVNCCPSIGAAFNAAFPGYIAGGVGPLLFNMARKALMANLAGAHA